MTCTKQQNASCELYSHSGHFALTSRLSGQEASDSSQTEKVHKQLISYICVMWVSSMPCSFRRLVAGPVSIHPDRRTECKYTQ